MIRPAELADYNPIIRIRETSALDLAKLKDNEYRVNIQRKGFLLPFKVEFEDFKKDLPKYNVFTEKDKILGYTKVDDKQDIDTKANIFWFDKKWNQLYYSQPHTYLYGIGVLPEARHKGIASQMLESALQKAKSRDSSYLFSLVVTSPVTNFPSMMFHEKNGFERIAVALEPLSLFDPDQYQAVIYAKKV